MLTVEEKFKKSGLLFKEDRLNTAVTLVIRVLTVGSTTKLRNLSQQKSVCDFCFYVASTHVAYVQDWHCSCHLCVFALLCLGRCRLQHRFPCCVVCKYFISSLLLWARAHICYQSRTINHPFLHQAEYAGLLFTCPSCVRWWCSSWEWGCWCGGRMCRKGAGA